MEKDYELIEIEEGIDAVVRSPRGMNLVLCMNYEWITPVLTVELYTKWYELILIEKKGDDFNAYSIHFGHLQDVAPAGVSPYLDHAPNPLCVKLFAHRNGYHIDELALELITGRWQIEYVESNVMQCDQCEGAGIVPLPPPHDVLPNTCRRCRGYGELKPGA